MPQEESDKALISDTLRGRLRAKKRRFYANDNISDVIESEDELKELIDEVTGKFEGVLDSLLIDRKNDPNSHDTGRRLAKMYINELLAGRFTKPPKVTSFPNEQKTPEGLNGDDHRPAFSYTGLLVIPADIQSMCSHHWATVTGVAYIGVLPGEHVIGLSKYVRLAQHLAQRGTLQEQLTVDILRGIQKAAGTENVAVVNISTHGCMVCRGVKAKHAYTSTAELGGLFYHEQDLRNEFYRQVEILEHRRASFPA
jgi:GTP cyclohydrolase I